jgi:SAM-dependent methyltransferase
MHQAFAAGQHAFIGSELGTHDFMEDNPYPNFARVAAEPRPVRTSVGGAPTYALGHSQRELTRLSTQATLFEPFTRRMFERAGLTRGMRVLDVGSGSGDVAFLAASFVGESGEVVGVDRSPAAVQAANARAKATGFKNVTFTAGDLTTMFFARPFDAVIGRLVLMYQADPVATLRRLARQLKPGGVIAFQEFDVETAKCYPMSSTFSQAMGWIRAALEKTGADNRMGLKLYSTFVAAGLPGPSMSLEASIGGGENDPGSALLPEVIRSLLPVMERLGIASAEQVQIESLESRVRAEIAELDAVTILPTLIGAWTKLSVT